eukprot:scaffold9834_cov105-Isochrysis_galbana.AAC.8
MPVVEPIVPPAGLRTVAPPAIAPAAAPSPSEAGATTAWMNPSVVRPSTLRTTSSGRMAFPSAPATPPRAPFSHSP